MPDANWHATTRTHRGNYREHNEDATLSNAAAPLWAVADGMGGHAAGDVASKAIASALGGLDAPRDSLPHRVDWMEDQLLQVDAQLHEQARQLGPGTVIGSTVVSLTVAGEVAVVLWAGDSRLYRLRANTLHVITRDHNPIADLLDCGAVSEAEALAANTNVITRAVGGQRPLELDVAVFDVVPGDTLLLCTDGLYRELDDWELQEVMQYRSLEVAADTMMERVLGRAARDNLSLVLVRAVGHE